MPNWASTSYRIEGRKEDLVKVRDAIKKARAMSNKDISKGWEGYVVELLGATKRQIGTNYLRGFIKFYEIDNNVLRIDAEETWGATDFRHVLADIMSLLSIYFIVEECGDEVYATNDKEGKYFTERFCLDTCINGAYRSDYFKTEEEVLNNVAEMLGLDKVDNKPQFRNPTNSLRSLWS